MLIFTKNTEDRKTLAHLIGDYIGAKPIYTRAPRYAFEIGPYTIDRGGDLYVAKADAHTKMLELFVEEGYITPVAYEDRPVVVPAPAVVELPVETEIYTLPIEGHTGESLSNLIFMFFSRAQLINKAIGTRFHVDGGLVDALKRDMRANTVEAFLQVFRRYEVAHGGGLNGIAIDEEHIHIMLPKSEAADCTMAYTQLASFMNRMSMERKRVQAKTVSDENDRYTMRVWLISLGFNGDEYKCSRKVLLKNLTGHSAFRTEQEAERAKEKAKRMKERKRNEHLNRETESIQTASADPRLS